MKNMKKIKNVQNLNKFKVFLKFKQSFAENFVQNTGTDKKIQ